VATVSKGPLNYTTTIDPDKSAIECIGRLAAHGAEAIGITYDHGLPTGVHFQIGTPWGQRSYSLPVNMDGTHKALQRAANRGRIPPRYATLEQARRVSWRVLKDWLEAQLALIEAGVAEMSQVMLPYMQVEQGVTVWDRYLENEQQAIEAGR
jgi:hypothetical protein